MSGSSASAAAALVRMNEDYLDLDFNTVQLLLVACINEYDPTRMHRIDKTASEHPDHRENRWLRRLCNDLDSIQSIQNSAKAYAEFIRTTGHPGAPVDPISRASATSASTPASPAPDNPILLAQRALKADNCDPGALDGKEGAGTDAAASCYQKKHKLKNTKLLDAATLLALKAISESR
jgi:hypothetical protein